MQRCPELYLRHVGFLQERLLLLKRTLQCHKRNNSGWSPSAMTDEALGCPCNTENVTKSAAVFRCICFKCRKGRGPYLSLRSSPRRIASLWNYVGFLSLSQTFLVNMYL